MILKNLNIKNSQGLTLVEVLISLLLLSIVLTGGLAFYFNSSEVMGLVTHKKFAAELASSILEGLKKDGYASLPAAGPGTPTALTATDDPEGIIRNLSATKTVSVTDIGFPVQYKEVGVRIRWTEAGETNPREARHVTYMAP